MYLWIKYLHILAVLTFLLAHGASAKAAFRLQHETSHERLAALLDLSAHYMTLVYLSLLVMLLAGVVSGFLGKWWSDGWIWLGSGLLIGIIAGMYFLASSPLSRLRAALRLPTPEIEKSQPALTSSNPEQIAARLSAIKPLTIGAIGFVGLLLIVGLMTFKPF